LSLRASPWKTDEATFNVSHCHQANISFYVNELPKPIWDRCYDFLNIFAENFSKKLAFLTQNKAKLCKILIITLVFEKNAIFFAENSRKSQKIVIITSTSGLWQTQMKCNTVHILGSIPLRHGGNSIPRYYFIGTEMYIIHGYNVILSKFELLNRRLLNDKMSNFKKMKKCRMSNCRSDIVSILQNVEET
jgi:hypothetical protein